MPATISPTPVEDMIVLCSATVAGRAYGGRYGPGAQPGQTGHDSAASMVGSAAGDRFAPEEPLPSPPPLMAPDPALWGRRGTRPHVPLRTTATP